MVAVRWCDAKTTTTGWQRNARSLGKEEILSKEGELAPLATRFGRGSGGVHGRRRSTSPASIGVAGKPVVGWRGEAEVKVVCWWAVNRADVERERGRGLAS
ncbi:hypothetical protein DEO72_LG2g1545 [Vigna unguiculata]|uniref:Uncharacterized protein n=1 Tax=Vigna unguiculata TaxID=3917 RepID=A0A4D6KWN8_VIGUN|nr:hypothetical protein DEO72_LG2g1545 [Vigna unguiculata]